MARSYAAEQVSWRKRWGSPRCRSPNERSGSAHCSLEHSRGTLDGHGCVVDLYWRRRFVFTPSWQIHATNSCKIGSIVYPNSPPILPCPNPWVSLASIIWQFWDPTWRTLQRAQLQGREARTDGKTVWVVSQLVMRAKSLKVTG